MKNRPIQKREIKRSPVGKTKSLAVAIFAREAANDAEKNRNETQLTLKERREKVEKRLNLLKAEILAAKDKNNKDHLSFAGGILAGSVAANFLGLQTEGGNTLVAKAFITAVAGASIFKLNTTFFFQSGVYKEMLRETNKLLEEHIDNSNEYVKVPSFKSLFDKATEIRVEKKRIGIRSRTVATRRIANFAVFFITGTALCNIGYEGYFNRYDKVEQISDKQKIPTQADYPDLMGP